jgi:ketosteroid isomerase-like protein
LVSEVESRAEGDVPAETTPTEGQGLTAVLARYQQAWAEGDVETIVAMTPPDGVYEASFGPDPWGRRFVGPDEVRAALDEMGIGQPGHSRHVYEETHVVGDSGFAMWKNVEDGPDGPRVTMHGADFYRLRDGMVVAKIAYRKSTQS